MKKVQQQDTLESLRIKMLRKKLERDLEKKAAEKVWGGSLPPAF